MVLIVKVSLLLIELKVYSAASNVLCAFSVFVLVEVRLITAATAKQM